MRRGVLIVAVALVSVVIMVASLTTYRNQVPSRPVKASTTDPNFGLRFVAELNSSTVRQGQFENLTVAVFNTKTVNNNLSDPNICQGNLCGGLQGSPCPVTKAISVFVSKGNLTLADIEGGHGNKNWSLGVGPFPPPGCHVPVYPYPDYWVFLPLNDSALPGLYDVPAPMHFTILMNGYHYPDYRYPLTIFEPGAYTVTAWDEWGQVLQVRFTVTL